MNITPIFLNYEPYLYVVNNIAIIIIFSFFLILCLSLLSFFLVIISFFYGSDLGSGILRYKLNLFNTYPNNNPNHW